MSKKHIVVIGAGVVGLQTAVSLLEAGYQVTVLAKHLPGDTATEYTSPWAGTMWCSNALPNETELQAWDRESYNVWMQKFEANPAEAEEAGILKLPKRLVWTGHHPYIPHGPANIWYARHVQNFTATDPSTLPAPFTRGATHDGLAINAPAYLKHLTHTIISLGGRIRRANLQPSSEQPGLAGLLAAALAFEALEDGDEYGAPAAIVNATGLAAKAIVPDDSVYAIRGQTVVVQGEAAAGMTTAYYAADAHNVATVVPRRGAGRSVLGGCCQVGNWDPRPDAEVTARIVARCKAWAPELLNGEGEFEVVAVNVGLGPGRKGGPRVEIERVDVQKEGDGGEGLGEMVQVVVCHCYGHGGSGFQNSLGSARKVVGLISEELKQGKV